MFFRTLATGILLTACAFAQMSSFPKPSYFRETFKSQQPKVELAPPARLNDFVQGGKLVLSLKDYIALVMSNNTDVQIQFLTIETARNNITSAYGTWDPSATFGFTPSIKNTDPLPNATGSTSQTKAFPLSFGFSQKLSSGQSITASGGGTKSATWGRNTAYASNMAFSVTQPLMQNRGSYVNRIPLMQAQSSFRVSEYQLRNQLLTLVNTAELAYWSVVQNRESVAVRTSARDVAQQYWEYVQKQFNLGAISYLDTYRPQQSVAQAEVDLSQAQFSLRNSEEALRKQIGADLDAAIRTLAISLTDSPDLSASENIAPDREQAVQRAIDLHPSIRTALQRLEGDDLSIATAKNGLLPQLDLKFGYSGAGGSSSSSSSSSSSLTDAAGSSYYGMGGALSQMFGWGNPTYSVSLNLTLPIRSRKASMTYANALISKKSDTLAVRNQQQSVRLNVLQAVTSLEGAKESLRLAKIQQDFSQKDYDAQVLKYQLGTGQQIEVVQSQQTLAAANLAVVNAQIALRRALVALYLQTGELLDQRGVVVQ